MKLNQRIKLQFATNRQSAKRKTSAPRETDDWRTIESRDWSTHLEEVIYSGCGGDFLYSLWKSRKSHHCNIWYEWGTVGRTSSVRLKKCFVVCKLECTNITEWNLNVCCLTRRCTVSVWWSHQWPWLTVSSLSLGSWASSKKFYKF